jgi:hypothetical protein
MFPVLYTCPQVFTKLQPSPTSRWGRLKVPSTEGDLGRLQVSNPDFLYGHHFLRRGVLLLLHPKCSVLPLNYPRKSGTGLEPVTELLLFLLSYSRCNVGKKESNLRRAAHGWHIILLQQHTESYYSCTAGRCRP